jgi:hypothetical protein
MTTTKNDDNILRRVERLERSNRRLRAASGVAFLSVLLLLTAGQAASPTRHEDAYLGSEDKPYKLVFAEGLALVRDGKDLGGLYTSVVSQNYATV